nr:hypothetical protein [Escherichia coli]
MSGKPAARQGDMTQYGGSIFQGSDAGDEEGSVDLFRCCRLHIPKMRG